VECNREGAVLKIIYNMNSATYLTENTITTLCLQATDLLRLLHTIDPTEGRNLEWYLHVFSKQIEKWEQVYTRQQIMEAILPIRQIAATSPFVNRAQCWPRGYAGDFETILYILENVNKAEPESLGYQIEAFFLKSPICMQHRNKVAQQSKLIAEVLEKNAKARILSIGCGTSEDLYNSLSIISNTACEITLVDIDKDALNYSLKKLYTVKDKITIIEGNIYKVIKRLNQSFDLILIGGVFDYLTDKVIAALLKELTEKLSDNGHLFFTNIGKSNPYRACMEYLADWKLIERNKEELSFFINQAAPEMVYNIELDATGLAYMVNLNK
jgi:extracellular factor (EF) 3-hydroxypalmitic acid methyl ester biosynthesis protein